jgi:RNA polymerase sigma-70 factor (ECF subfamily)
MESTPNILRAAESDDCALMSAIAAGDRMALATLYNRHNGTLLAVLERIMREPALAEDLLHDVFLEVWHHAAAYDPIRGSVRTWLIIRARSRALDRRKKLMRDRELITRTYEVGTAPMTLPASESAAGDRARVHGVTARLSSELQQVVELAYFEGLSSSEIADDLQIPIGTVKSRMARALASLRVAFGVEWELRT